MKILNNELPAQTEQGATLGMPAKRKNRTDAGVSVRGKYRP